MRTLRLGLFLTLTLALVASSNSPPNVRASSLIWSANFETGDHSQFNQCWVQSGGAALPAIATNIVHNGKYSEYDFYDGKGDSSSPHRSYCGQGLNITSQYTNIENDIWIYVPSTVNGTQQNYQEWFTFVNLFFGQSTLPNQYPVFVLGCSSATGYYCDHRQLSLGSGPFAINNTILARNNVTWPLDEWFELRTLVIQTKSISVITLYQVANSTQQLVENMTSATVGMYLFQAHWGLYDGPTSGISAIYNDDITIFDITTSTTTAIPEYSGTTTVLTILTATALVLCGRRTRPAEKPLRSRPNHHEISRE